MEIKKEFNYQIESLRGLAAVLVAWHHPIIHKYYLDASYMPKGILAYNPPGHLSVLIFFILSGYVIGLTNKKPLSRQSILPYLRKRIIRIYPIYALCIILALIVSPTAYDFKTIFSQFTLTQVTLTHPLREIDPIWSLNYEILFYLLFIPVSLFRINPLILAATCVVVGVVNIYLFSYLHTPLLSGYAFGFSFWLIGLSLSQHLQYAKTHISYASMASMLFIILSIEKFNVLSTLLPRVTIALVGSALQFPTCVPWEKNIITFNDYALLPYATIAITIFIAKDFPFRKHLVFTLIILPFLTYYSLFKHYNDATSNEWILPATFYFIGMCLFLFRHAFEDISRWLITALIPLGSISYGLYLVHFPILCAFTRIHNFSSSPSTFAVRFCCYMMLSISAAYYLEKHFQPWAKRMLDS